jgi:predicted PurR-regulated permease PerM
MPKTPQTTHYWPYVLMLSLAVGLVFIAPYLGVVCLAALMAYLFYPMFRALSRKIKSPAIAASLTLIMSLVIVILPVALVLFLTFIQLGSLAADLTTAYSGPNASTLPEFAQEAIGAFNSLIAPLSGQDPLVTGQGVTEFLRSTVPDVIRTVTTIFVGVVGSIPIAIILSIMYVTLFLEFLMHGKKLLATIRTISPFETPVTNLYLARIGVMADAMAKGQLLISFIISVLSAFLLIFLGLGEYFFLMVVVFTILNLVPLGCGVVVIPITLIAILLGNVWPGIIVLVLYILVSNLEAVIRPRLIPKEAQLSAGLTMLAAFGGIYYYGLLGVVYGPVLMIVIVTTISMYTAYKKGELKTA